MGKKGEETKKEIRSQAYDLFAEKGFNAVTMKDICEKTGLSRGGLYRHYDSTKTIFEEIFLELEASASDDIEEKMEQNVPITDILEEFLEQLRNEMLDSHHSLSLAIYEYANTVSKDFFIDLNEKGLSRWHKLLTYGMSDGSFNKVDQDQIIDLICFSYQGVRMWSRVINIEPKTADHIIDTIKMLLLPTK